MEKLLLKPAEVAELIGVSRSRAYELIGAGVLPVVKLGASVRVPTTALREWIARQLDAGGHDSNPAPTYKTAARTGKV